MPESWRLSLGDPVAVDDCQMGRPNCKGIINPFTSQWMVSDPEAFPMANCWSNPGHFTWQWNITIIQISLYIYIYVLKYLKLTRKVTPLSRLPTGTTTSRTFGEMSRGLLSMQHREPIRSPSEVIKGTPQ